MENKSVCYYCGTIYESELDKCPLCGSTVRSSEDAAARPAPRRRLTEKERKERQRAARGKYVKKKESKISAKPIKIAALVFLILSVLVVFYFIADMIGWLPGLENSVQRETAAASTFCEDCEELSVEPECIQFTAVGETAELTVRVNAYCKEMVYIKSANENVVSISKTALTEEGEEDKTAVFTLTASGLGQTEITVSCGDKSLSCPVVCGDPDASVPTASTQAATAPEDFEPELNYEHDVSLSARGEKLVLRVTNLPDGMEVSWVSEDESVAKVNAYGEVTAIGGGKTKVTATVGGKSVELLIRCNFGDFIDKGAHLDSGRSDVTVTVGESFALFLYDSDGDHITDITYTIEDPSICKVEDGYVTALAWGTTEITITYYDMEFTCIVRVRG